MKRNLITLAAVVAIVTGGFIAARGEPNSGNAPATTNSNAAPAPGLRGFRGGPHGGGDMFTRITERLNLTAEQKAKVQPILDQAKPQLQQIRDEAMEKSRTVMESAIGQIRPILTQEQQAKLDQMQNARENMHNAMQKMHEAEGD